MRRPSCLVAIVSLAVGCTPPKRVEPQDERGSGDASRQEKAPAPATPETSVNQPTIAPLELPTLPGDALEPAANGYELLAAGDEPRALLRMSPREGDRDQVRLSLAMTVSVTGTGMPPMRQQLPRFERLATAEIERIADDRITQRLVHADSSSADAKPLEQVLVFNDRGARLESRMTMPEDVSPQLRKSLETLARAFEQALVVLPAEPIGVGGKWKVSSAVENGGIPVEQTVEFELISREGDRVEIAAQISQRSLTTQFTPPNQPNQADELELVDFVSKGASRMLYELTEPLPEALDARLETSFTTRTRTESPRALSFAMTLELGLRRAD